MADSNYGLDDAVAETIQSQNQSTATQIRNNLTNSIDVNPDQEANYQHLAKFTGTPIDTVRAKPDVVKQRAALGGTDAEDMTLKSPVTAKFFTDPDKTKLAIDDIANMRDLEAMAQPGLLSDAVTGIKSTDFKIVGAWDKAAVALDNMLPDGTPGKMTPEQREYFTQRGALLQQEANSESAPKRWTGQVTSGLTYVPFLGAAPLVVGASEGTARSQMLQDSGVDKATANEAGVAEGALQAVFQMIPMGKFIPGFGPATFVKSALTSLAKAGTVGATQTVASDYFTQALLNSGGYDKQAADFAPTVKKAVEGALFMMGLHGGTEFVTSGLHTAANLVANRNSQVEKSQGGVDYVQSLSDAASLSKVRVRDPEAFNKFMTDVSENGPVQDLYANATDLAQSGVDLNKLAEAVPSLADNIRQAVSTGTDIKIPVGDFATHLANTELGQSMLDHLKTDPNDFSKVQIDDYMKTQGETLKGEVEKVLAEKAGDNEFKASRQVVYDNVLGQLNKANRFTEDVNAPYATLLSNFYAVQAARLGITPEEMFAKHPVSIGSESAFGRDTSLGQDEAPDMTKPQRSPLGFYSSVERETINMNLPNWKKEGGEAKGTEIWNKLKSLPVKKEELEWLGVEDYLTSRHSKEKFTREDVINFIRQGGVKVEEIVGDQEAADAYGHEFNWRDRVIDDPDYVNGRAEDILSEMRDNPEYYPGENDAALNQVIEDEQDYIRKNLDGYENTSLRDMQNDPAVHDYAMREFGDAINSKLEDAAQEIAQEDYDQNPYMEYHDPDTGYEIFGNDDVGYTMRDANGNSFGDVEYSFSEAEIQARDHAMEHGVLDGENSPNTAKWGDYVANGNHENYRELKLTLPDVGDSFVYNTHFDDENIVAFLRVDDRRFSKTPEQKIEGRDSKVAYEVKEFKDDDGTPYYRVHAVDDEGTVRSTTPIYWDRAEAEKQIPEDAATKTVKVGAKTIPAQRGKAYFIEDFQSDWHQEGRQSGYKGDAPRDMSAWTVTKTGDDKYELWTLRDEKGDVVAVNPVIHTKDVPDAAEALAKLKERAADLEKSNQVANAPFKDDAWISLGVKRAIIDAVEKGYDKIAWVDGETLTNRWSDRYRTLYETQYDKKMPSIFKKIMGETPRHITDTIDEKGHTLETELTDGDGYWEVDITPALRERIQKEGLPLFQGQETRRGSFNTETNAITLFKAADLSTFLHESGHFFLETMNKLALEANAPPEIKADMDATLQWLGVKDLADWNSRSLEEKRDAHEQFARGFEAYLFEGKSPNKEMQGIFARFRAWLMNIYRSIGALNVDVSDDMKAVFDRMLATSDEIKDMEAERAYAPFFAAAKEAGMTEDEFKAYQNLGIEATQQAISNLESRSLNDMKYASNAKSRVLKQLQAQAATKRKSIRREVTDEVMHEPVYQVQTFLKRGIDPVTGDKVEGGFKLSIPEIEAMYGDTSTYRLITEKLGYGKYGMLGTENGIHPDQVAEMFGFSSGDQMIKAILAAESPRDKIEGLTDQRMLERYGDINSPEALSKAADEAIHNDVRMKFVATEMNALQKAIGGKKILAEAAKSYAATMIDRLKVRDLKPGLYTAAEARSAKAAELLRKDGDLQGAAIQKRNQLINMYATKAVYEAQEFVEKSVKYLQKFDKDGIRKTIDPEYVDQINTMLERFSLANRSLKSIDKQKSLADWVESQKELGIEPDIAPEIMNEANRKNYKDMSVEEMRGLVDAVKQVEHLGKLKNKLLTAKDKRDFDTTVNGIITSIQDNAGDKVADNRTRARSYRLAQIGDLFKGYFASHRKVANLARELDGWKDGGPMWETFVRSMNEAGDKEATMRAEATKKLAPEIEPFFKRGRMGGKGIFFESVGRSLNREERIGIALNVGNESNMQRLLGGEGWTPEAIQPILDTLNADDARAIQAIWDHFESYRPLIAAKEKRVYGVEPEWIEARPITIGGVELRGGYYPVKYDPRQSVAAEQHSAAEAAKAQMRGAYTSATTRRSFTKSRVDEVMGRPLLYSMDGLFSGLDEVIHDLSWHEWLIDANRLLRNKGLDGAIRNRYGADFVKQFKTATQDIAGGEMSNADAVDKALAHIRKGTTVSGLGFNLMNSMINVVGITQSYVRIGPQWIGLGIKEWATNPRGFVDNIHQKSSFMRLRAQTQQRELNEIRQRISGKTKAGQIKDRVMFFPMEITQLAVDTPTWWGAYQKALAGGNEEARAVSLADQAVIDAQGGGQLKDLAAIQRGGGQTGKLLTTFYGFFSTTYNLSVEATKKTNFRDPKSVARLGHDYLALMIVPAVLSSILNQAVTDGAEAFDDLSKVAKILANDGISYFMGQFVGAREMTGAAQKLAGVNTYSTGYGGPASLRFFSEADKLAQQVNQGELDRALRKSAINIAGIVFHLPGTQVNRTIDGITAIADGKTANPLAIATGGPRN